MGDAESAERTSERPAECKPKSQLAGEVGLDQPASGAGPGTRLFSRELFSGNETDCQGGNSSPISEREDKGRGSKLPSPGCLQLPL